MLLRGPQLPVRGCEVIGWQTTARPEPCSRCGRPLILLAAYGRCSDCQTATEQERRERALRADLVDAGLVR